MLVQTALGKGEGAHELGGLCRLALATVMLSQGRPFVHAGDDLLRSKSLDRDSYNSGDWFNRCVFVVLCVCVYA